MSYGMAQMIAMFEGLPDGLSLLVLGSSLLLAGTALRKAIALYQRIAARRATSALREGRAEAGL